MCPDDPHSDLGGGIGHADEQRSLLDWLFARITASFPSFVAPATPEARGDWYRHLKAFSREELSRAVSDLVGKRSARPDIAKLAATADAARNALQAEARLRAAREGNASTRGEPERSRTYCGACQRHLPLVAITRAPDNSFSARLHQCACVRTTDPAHTVLVSLKDLDAHGINLAWICFSPEADVVAKLLPEWVPPARQPMPMRAILRDAVR